MKLFFVVLPFLPLLLQSAEPKSLMRPARAPPLDPWILSQPATSSLSSSQCWCSLYPCNIPGTSPDPSYTSSYFARRVATSICPRSSFASIESACFLRHRGDKLSRIPRDRRKPVQSCVSRKAKLVTYGGSFLDVDLAELATSILRTLRRYLLLPRRRRAAP